MCSNAESDPLNFEFEIISKMQKYSISKSSDCDGEDCDDKELKEKECRAVMLG